MNFAGLRPIGSAVLLVLLAGAGCNRPKRASSESSAAPTPQAVRASITAHAPDAFYDPPSDVPHTAWRVTAERAAQGRDTASRHPRLAHPLCNHCGRQHASDGGRDSVRADRSSRRPTSCHRMGARLRRACCRNACRRFCRRRPRASPERDRIVMAGWVVVATDYSFAEKGGPHPYLIGEGEARAALDSVRAARQMSELTLDKRMVVWGYSQGGHAALWTGIVGPRYAPDLEILGVAAIAPAANIKNILAMNVEMDKRFGPYLALSYSRFYPDITFEQAVRPEALDAARQIVNLCDFVPPEDPERIEALAATFDGPALATSSNKALQARLEQNTADGPIQAPVVIAQGLSDIVVPPSATDAYVEERCAAGQRLEYWTFAGRDHLTIIQPGTPLEELLIKWTTARFANEPQASGCVRKSF